jgi:DNA ligase D-like protein (predicted ligase)
MPSLPEFVPPMLARIGTPFDSDEHEFEVKWDGTRVLAFRDADGLRLRNRKRRDVGDTYPELDALLALPAGTVLDGEVVVFEDGRPDFRGMLQREQARGRARALALARTLPASYVAFDLLYDGFTNIMARPLSERRERLRALISACGAPHLQFSDGVVGGGRALFAEAKAQGLEGIVAKRRSSPYRPGRRTDEWQKIKGTQQLHCLVLGYVPSGEGDFKSLVVAADDGGVLRCVGRVGSGLDDATRAALLARMRQRPRAEPLVPVPFDGRWIEPGLYCVVGFLERTRAGMLRAPVFERMIDDPGDDA